MKFKFTFFSLLIVILVSCQEKKAQSLEEDVKSSIAGETKKSTVYNEAFLTELKTIRETQHTPEEKLLKINEDVIFSFPSKYNIERHRIGHYKLELSDSLIFTSHDYNLIQYQIKSKSIANGELNILKKPNVTYDIKKTIAELKQTKSPYKLIDTDNFGYMYEYFKEYHIPVSYTHLTLPTTPYV